MLTIETETVNISVVSGEKKKMSVSEAAFGFLFRFKGEDPTSETLWVL